jgi:hypothetical protein
VRDPVTEEPVGPDVREALVELQLYLSDSLAPMMVANSINLLLEYPPELAAFEINAWTSAQFRGLRGAVPVSDYFFHALDKIHQMGQYELVEKEQLARYLEELARIVIEHCPEEDRDLLRSNLARLGQGETVLAAPVEILHRQVGSQNPLASAAPSGSSETGQDEVAKRLRRFSILFERWEASSAGRAGTGATGATASETAGDPAGPAAGKLGSSSTARNRNEALLSQLLTVAATSSRSDGELARTLEKLRRLGLEMQTADAFRVLGRTLPAWNIPMTADAAESTGSMSRASASSAIRRIVTLPEDPVEVARRFHEMLQAGVEQFNKGSLPRAARMFSVASRLIAEKRIDAAAVDASRRKVLKTLDHEKLRSLGEDPAQHPMLRQVLNFFPPLTPPSLLSELQHEEKRERRRVILSLLEVHGAEARAAALEGLVASTMAGNPEDEWHFKRNLLYLLRRIPRPADQPWDTELDCLIKLSGLNLPPPLVKEAIANLGLVKHEKAEAVLVSRVQALERMLQKKADAPSDQKELQPLLDRAVATLARFGTSTARRVVVEQGLKKKTALGDATARLAELSGQDLSDDPELVAMLLKNLKAKLPFKVLGFALKKNDDKLLHLVESLSSTPLPQVQKVFEEIVRRFPNTTFAAAAAKELASFGTVRAEEAHAPSLTGDLELFELPSLMQSLGVSEVSGILTLRGLKGETVGTMTLEKGKIRGAEVGVLQGDDACYQLFEKPVAGTFSFVKTADIPPRHEGDPPPRDVLPVLLEGMRRYDEFQRMAALVPDEIYLSAGDAKPTAQPDEQDPTLQKDVWSKAAAGASPRLCEESIPVDSFRVRRLLAYWLEEGSLKPI